MANSFQMNQDRGLGKLADDASTTTTTTTRTGPSHSDNPAIITHTSINEDEQLLNNSPTTQPISPSNSEPPRRSRRDYKLIPGSLQRPSPPTNVSGVFESARHLGIHHHYDLDGRIEIKFQKGDFPPAVLHPEILYNPRNNNNGYYSSTTMSHSRLASFHHYIRRHLSSLTNTRILSLNKSSREHSVNSKLNSNSNNNNCNGNNRHNTASDQSVGRNSSSSNSNSNRADRNENTRCENRGSNSSQRTQTGNAIIPNYRTFGPFPASCRMRAAILPVPLLGDKPKRNGIWSSTSVIQCGCAILFIAVLMLALYVAGYL